ncbi:DM13 domain-containing protein [Rubrivirga sp.]|uniref:DM13 domain-containing protein n=1 Tax=Rubrivirga sp. TaxID=1885344 RepID=UPI003B522C09
MRLALIPALVLALAACGAETEPAADPAPAAAVPVDVAAAPDASTDSVPTMPVSDVMPPAPEVVAEGRFSGAEGHDVAGRALLVRLDDGSHIVRLEGLDSENGPDLRVWLLTDLSDKADGRVDLGRLKSTRGDQNYAVPAGADVSAFVGVSVWCRAFSVEFGTASLG